MNANLKLLSSALLIMVAAACGSSTTKKPCPDGVKAGASVMCDCGAAGKVGTQACKSDLTLGNCACPMGSKTDGGTGDSGSTSSGSGTGSGGSSASGGSGGTKASGGTGGSSSGANKDGGMTTQGDGGSSGPVTPLPKDGNELAVCSSGVDCNMGFDCYNSPGPSQGFCTKVCSTDDDCKALSGGTYTCRQPQGRCVIMCTGTDDKSCPAQMTCQQLGGGGGGFPGGGGPGGPPGTGGSGAADGGATGTFICTYPEGAGVVKQPLWGMCMSTSSVDCDTNLVCSGVTISASGTGFCTQTCMMDPDCTAMPSSGVIKPSCAAVPGGGGGPGGGGMTQPSRCVLDCTMNVDGCPDGMECRPAGGGGGGMMGGGGGMMISRCTYK